jgi:two-component sensor histidine kinase
MERVAREQAPPQLRAEQSKGLGMKLVQGFVQSLDGELIIDSSQAGSRFTVLMPPPTLM